MVHGLDTVGTAIEAVSVKEDTAGFERFVAPVNYVVTIISSTALVVASFVYAAFRGVWRLHKGDVEEAGSDGRTFKR